MRRVRAFCRLCFSRCSIILHVDNGRIVSVEADKNPPKGHWSEICPKALAIPDIIYHPNRLRRPLIRAGERGEGRWREATLGEALDLVARRLREVRERHGPKALMIGLGFPKGLELAFAQRFASVYGTPNIVTPGYVCHIPRVVASRYTYGGDSVPEGGRPNTILLWGVDPDNTRSLPIPLSTLNSWLRDGSRLIVIDPRRIRLVDRAWKWLRLRPGSDEWLAIALLKVVVEEGLYDREFVEKHCRGFDELRRHLERISLDEAVAKTWLSIDDVREVAREYALRRPGVILWGNALDHHVNAIQAARAICILRAITGNLFRPGGEVIAGDPPVERPGRFFMLRDRPLAESVGADYPLIPTLGFVPAHAAVRAVLEGRPYRIRAAIFVGTNPLLTYPNASRVYEALERLDFIAVLDHFMTPTAAMADVVIPAAHPLEFDEIFPYPPAQGKLMASPKVVDPPSECIPDPQFFCELARRLGLDGFWNDYREGIEEILRPAGLSYEELKRRGVLVGPRIEEPRGLRTASGKVEIYSEGLAKLGVDPLPTPRPVEEPDEEYPLLLTSYKHLAYVHSAYREVGGLRRLSSEPLAELHPETARRYGIAEGDAMRIETRYGAIVQRAKLNPHLDPRVVIASYGWWYPERGPGSWRDANINILTSDESPQWTGLGSVAMRGIPCRVSRVEGHERG